MIPVILVIRHAQKSPKGKLTHEGRQTAIGLGRSVRQMGFADAIVAPNDRCRETATKANLRILGEEESLAIPDGYEEYLNKVVVARMLKQEGKPWEKSFTKAALEDPLCDEFKKWGLELADAVRLREGEIQAHLRQAEAWDGFPELLSEIGPRPHDLVLIGSSPIIELSYLSILGSEDWKDLPHCRELEGYILECLEKPRTFQIK